MNRALAGSMMHVLLHPTNTYHTVRFQVGKADIGTDLLQT
jgi:hypothetical protein